MSHWQKSKLNLVCSEQILRRALINIVPEWENYIRVDPNAGLTIINMNNEVQGGMSVKVPKNAPGSSYCDFGAQKKADGTWELIIDPAGTPRSLGGHNAENVIKAEVSAIRSRFNNERAGNTVISEKREGNKIIQRVLIPIRG